MFKLFTFILAILLASLVGIVVIEAAWMPELPALPEGPGVPALCPMGMSLTEMPVEYVVEYMIAQEQGQQPPPVVCDDEGNCTGGPAHKEPTDFCYSHKVNDKAPCMCTKNATDLCKPGNQNKEHMSCNSWCWRGKWCRCCKS